jgi:NADH:ubiquinone oxidoreductase subunit 4 (subunit M)
VEVSTGMSIFLSCILLKVCLYGLMRLFITLNTDFVIWPFLVILGLGVCDLVMRLAIQIDLKAIIAYGSVLHMNLFLILFFLDTQVLSTGGALYIFGHSFSTAGAFIAVHYFERVFGSRLVVELSGVLSRSTPCAVIGTFVFLSFIDFPLLFFFWGEVWLWSLLLDVAPLLGLLLMFLSTVVYTCFLARLWLGVLLGAPSRGSVLGLGEFSTWEFLLFVYVYGIQFLVGIQPSILGWVLI